MREEWKVVKENAYLGGQEDADESLVELQVVGICFIRRFPPHLNSSAICLVRLRLLQDLDAANGGEGDKSGIQDLDDAEESKEKERERESAQEKDRATAEEAKEDTPQVKRRMPVRCAQCPTT